MKYLKIQCLIISIILCCQYTNAQTHNIEVSKVFIETSTGVSEICHEAHDHSGVIDHNIAFRPSSTGKAAFITNDGLFELGSSDVCLRDYDTDVYLAVTGKAVKSGDPMWEGTSDRRLKRNIRSLENSTEKFMNIKFYSYEYKRTGKARYGIMAQEVKEDFPHSVGTFRENGEEYYTFNPNNLFFTGMKVIQENSKQIIEQDQQIRTLEAENQALKAKLEAERSRNDQQETRLQAIEVALANQGLDIPRPTRTEAQPKPVTSTIHINIEHDRPQLQQNIPNPFSQFTTIPYYLPEGTQSATLLIHDMTGKMIAKHTLPSQKGAGKIDVDIEGTQLRGGTFTYSLYINEALIDTKKMVLLSK